MKIENSFSINYNDLSRVLLDETMKNPNVSIRKEAEVTDVIKSSDKIHGVIINGKEEINCDLIVMASGAQTPYFA